MSNFGMQQFGRASGIQMVSTAVGDRYVLEEMLRQGYNLGGEDSGHIILKDYANTGDGQLTAVQLLRIYKQSGLPMSELAKAMVKSPQVMRNLPAAPEAQAHFLEDEQIIEAIREVERSLGDRGRILVRASGTEPLIRVMLEGDEYTVINEYCDQVCRVIQERIG